MEFRIPSPTRLCPFGEASILWTSYSNISLLKFILTTYPTPDRGIEKTFRHLLYVSVLIQTYKNHLFTSYKRRKLNVLIWTRNKAPRNRLKDSNIELIWLSINIKLITFFGNIDVGDECWKVSRKTISVGDNFEMLVAR